MDEARAFFKKWFNWSVRSKLPEIVNGAKMLKRHLDGLLNFVLLPITNAVAEGINSKIQALKSDARGFRNFFNFRTLILFFCGKLDRYPSTHENPRRTQSPDVPGVVGV